MKLKKALFLLLIIPTIFFITGCVDKNIIQDNSTDGNVNSLNETLEITKLSGETVIEIEHYGSITQTPNGLFYCKMQSNTSEMDYFLYSISSKQEIMLGTVHDWIYEVFYDNIIYGNNLYTIIITGNAVTYENLKLNLYCINLDSGEMNLLYVDSVESPYISMTFLDSRIIISKPGSEKCYIEEYNLSTNETKIVKEYLYNKETLTGETIRHITSDSQNIYLLRLLANTDTSAQLFVDIFDKGYSLIDSIEITEAVLSNSGTEIDEPKQLVAKFFFYNDFIYYENFSITRFLGQVSTNQSTSDVKVIFETDALFSMAIDCNQHSDDLLFYRTFDSDNKIYLLKPNESILSETTFYADNIKYYITYIIKNDDEIIIFMNYKDPKTGETLPTKVYFMNLSDFDWNIV